MSRVGAVPTPVRAPWNPDTCPASLLPWLAWAFSVDEWDASWTDAQKRETVKRSILVHRHKGTIGAVREAIQALGVEAQLQEWFNQVPAGDPYTFRLLLDAEQSSLNQAQLFKLLDVVNGTKNLRSHLDAVVPGATSRCVLYSACVAVVGSDITVEYEAPAPVPGSPLTLDGVWLLDGNQDLDGIRN